MSEPTKGQNQVGVIGRVDIKRLDDQAPEQGYKNAYQHHKAHDVGKAQNQGPGHVADEIPAEFGEYAGDKKLRVHAHQHEKSPEEQEVVEAEFFTDNAQLAETIGQHAGEAGNEAVESVFSASQADHCKEPEYVFQEKKYAANTEDGKNDIF